MREAAFYFILQATTTISDQKIQACHTKPRE